MPTKRPVVASRNSLKRLLVEVLRVRIEAGDHAADRVVDQLLLVDRLDVVGLDHARTRRRAAGALRSAAGRRELRAVASSCIVVNAPATAPRASQPATLSLTPMNDPFRFRRAAALSVDWRKVHPQYIPASKFRAWAGPESCMRLSTLQGETPQQAPGDRRLPDDRTVIWPTAPDLQLLPRVIRFAPIPVRRAPPACSIPARFARRRRRGVAAGGVRGRPRLRSPHRGSARGLQGRRRLEGRAAAPGR